MITVCVVCTAGTYALRMSLSGYTVYLYQTDTVISYKQGWEILLLRLCTTDPIDWIWVRLLPQISYPYYISNARTMQCGLIFK